MKKTSVFIFGVIITLLILSPFLLRAQSNERNRKWEYQVVSTGMKTETAQERLNKLADEGWELVNGTDSIMYLKRQVQ